MLTISDDIAKILDNLENIEKETKGCDAHQAESDRASATRRRRTRYTSLPGIMESEVYLAPSAWPPARRASLCERCTRWQCGRGLGITYPFLGAAGYKSCMAGNGTRFLRICMPRVILRTLSAYRRENHLSLVYVFAMYMSIQTALFQYTMGRSTDSVMDVDDSLSYSVTIVGLTVILQSTR